MRRIVIGAALTGAGMLLVRALGPKLHKRCAAECRRMFEHKPDDHAAGAAEPLTDVSTTAVGHAA